MEGEERKRGKQTSTNIDSYLPLGRASAALMLPLRIQSP